MTTKSLFDMTLLNCVIYILVSIIILLSNSVGSINRRMIPALLKVGYVPVQSTRLPIHFVSCFYLG